MSALKRIEALEARLTSQGDTARVFIENGVIRGTGFIVLDNDDNQLPNGWHNVTYDSFEVVAE
jgi:hypothetical protein